MTPQNHHSCIVHRMIAFEDFDCTFVASRHWMEPDRRIQQELFFGTLCPQLEVDLPHCDL